MSFKNFKFSVVEFLEEKSFAAVPTAWVNFENGKYTCRWPKGTKLLQLIQDPESNPKSNWKTLEVKLFRSFSSDDYNKANGNVDEARILSGGESQSASEASDSDIPTPARNRNTNKAPIPVQSPENLPLPPTTNDFNDVTDPVVPNDDNNSIIIATPENSGAEAEVPSTDAEFISPLVIQTIPSQADQNFQKTVLEYLEDLKSEINIISAKVGALAAVKDYDDGEVVFKLPLLDEEDVHVFEAQLEDSTVQKLLLAELSKIGGLDITDTTARVLSHVFGQSIAERTSKTGRGDGNKFGFMKLKCSSTILEAILKNPRCAGRTMKDVEIALEKWFNGAKDRKGGRERRRKNRTDDGPSNSEHQQ